MEIVIPQGEEHSTVFVDEMSFKLRNDDDEE